MPTLDATFVALLDPGRRGIHERVGRGPATLSQLARPSGLTLNGIKKHVGILELAGLAETRRWAGPASAGSAPPRRSARRASGSRPTARAWVARLDRFERFVEHAG